MKTKKMAKKETYKKYYGSDIFNLDVNQIPKEAFSTAKSRKVRRIIQNTKEDVFNIAEPKRIQRNINKNNENISKSVEKKHKNYGESDIFFQKKSSSCEKRKGVKFIPKILNKSTFLYENRNIEEYEKDLKDYERLHRNNNNNYNPDKYINKVSTNERYFKAYYDDNIPINEEENKKKKEEQLKKYIHDRKFLKAEISQLNDTNAERKGNTSKEKRYVKQRRNKSEERRFFADSKDFPKYNCEINKQIQMESNIFNMNQPKEKDYLEEAKEIYHRLEKVHKNQNNINKRTFPNKLNNNNNKTTIKNAYAERIKKNKKNLDLLPYSNNSISYTGIMKDLFLLNNSRNYDLITGKEIPKKIPIKNLKKEKTDNKKIQEIIESIPNLSDHTKLQARMKASVLDFKNNKDYAKKQKELIDFYKNNPNKIRKNNHITLKIGEKNNDILINTDNINEKPSANYIMTYTSKGQFDKFDSNELKNMFIKKGMQAYDFDNKNTYNGKNLNSISFKLKGQDTDKINNIEKELKNENYKIKIRKDDNIKKFNNEKVNKMNEEKRFKIMPKEMIQRKGFSRQFSKY